MKHTMGVALIMILISLSACGGQTHLNVNPGSPQGFAAAPQTALTPNAPLINTPQGNPSLPSPLAPQPTQARPAATSATTTSPSKSATTVPKSTPVKPSTAATGAQTPSTSAATPALSAPATKAPQISAGQLLLNKAVARFDSLKSFKISVDGFETSAAKGPTSLSFQMMALNGLNKIEVQKHTNSLYVGVKMGYQSGTDKISVRPSGALGFVKLDTQMNDERLLTARGYRLDQIDAFAISQRLLKGNQQPKILGKTQLNGRNIAILEYTHANTFDASITRELLGIDMEDYFMRIHEMYEGANLVFSLKLSNVQLDAPVTAKDLEV